MPWVDFSNLKIQPYFDAIDLDISIPVTLCPSSAKRSAKKPVPVPTSKISRFFFLSRSQFLVWTSRSLPPDFAIYIYIPFCHKSGFFCPSTTPPCFSHPSQNPPHIIILFYYIVLLFTCLFHINMNNVSAQKSVLKEKIFLLVKLFFLRKGFLPPKSER